MSKASKKVDSLMLDSRREATSQVNDDPLLAVEAKLAGYQKTLQKVLKRYRQLWGGKALRAFSCPPQQPTLVHLHVCILPLTHYYILDRH